MDATSVEALSVALFGHVLGVFTDADVTLPDRRVRQVGAAAYDCPLLVVQFLRVVPGAPGQPTSGPQFCVVRRSAEFTVGVLRCVPTVDDTGRPPAATAITAAHSAILTDAALVARAAETFPHPTEGYMVGVGATAAIPEQGGLAGVAVKLTIEVP